MARRGARLALAGLAVCSCVLLLRAGNLQAAGGGAPPRRALLQTFNLYSPLPYAKAVDCFLSGLLPTFPGLFAQCMLFATV